VAQIYHKGKRKTIRKFLRRMHSEHNKKGIASCAYTIAKCSLQIQTKQIKITNILECTVLAKVRNCIFQVKKEKGSRN